MQQEEEEDSRRRVEGEIITTLAKSGLFDVVAGLGEADDGEVVVDEADGAGDGRGAELGGEIDQAVAGEGGYRLRAAGVAAAFHHLVEFVQETFGEGDAEAGDFVGFRAGHRFGGVSDKRCKR